MSGKMTDANGMDVFAVKAHYKRQAKALAAMIDFGPDAESKVERSSGDVICDVCKLPYRDHPYDEEYSAVITCEGKLYHL